MLWLRHLRFLGSSLATSSANCGIMWELNVTYSRRGSFHWDGQWNTDTFDAGLAIAALGLLQYCQIFDGCQRVWVLFD